MKYKDLPIFAKANIHAAERNSYANLPLEVLCADDNENFVFDDTPHTAILLINADYDVAIKLHGEDEAQISPCGKFLILDYFALVLHVYFYPEPTPISLI
jgi:hypothetical protein